MDSIEKRIAKLLSLAQNNDNVHEAASAMAMVEKLLAEHNLSLSGVTGKLDNTCGVQVNEKETSHAGVNGKSVPRWLGNLGWCILVAYPVKIIYVHPGDGLTVRFMGVNPDVEIAKTMYDYLYKTLFRAWAKRTADVTDKAAFFQGFTEALYTRLYKMVNERDKNLGAIVLSKETIVKEYAVEKYGKTKKARMTKNHNFSETSYTEGVIAGKAAAIPYNTHEKRPLHE